MPKISNLGIILLQKWSFSWDFQTDDGDDDDNDSDDDDGKFWQLQYALWVGQGEL